MNPVNGAVLRKLPILAVSLVAIAVVAMMLSASYASAGPGPKAVRGYVKDNVGNELEGAHVLVEILIDSTTTVRTSDTYDSDSNGFYSVLFGAFDWEVGDTIKVTSTYNSNVEVNSTTANDKAIQYVNITYPYEIPQFGGWIGLAITGGLVAAVALVIMGMPRKQKSSRPR
jgi:hypothetical protein